MSPPGQTRRCSGVQRCGVTAGCASLVNAMPRGPRLDAPGTLHHIMVRGIERRRIFLDDEDRDDFLTRLAGLAKRAAVTVYAWALLPNHAHRLPRRGAQDGKKVPDTFRAQSMVTGSALARR